VERILGIFKRRNSEPDCEEVQNLSSDFLDDDLDVRTRQQVDAHTAWCAPCSAFMNTLRATVGLLRSTPKQRAPSGFERRVRDQIEKERSA